jgi:N-methylhydantoinase A
VTDALVVLGYLNPTALLGGRMPIDADAAAAAVTNRIAAPLGISPERAALGIFDVVNANMIGGIRSVSVERGYDPRDFRLVAGGGATSAHAGRLAVDLGIPEVVIPRVASGLCAFGEAVADVKHTYLASYTTPLPALDVHRLNELFTALEERGRRELAEEGFAADDVYVERTVDMKYVDQVHECRVDVSPIATTDGFVNELATAFHRRHEALYTYCEPDNTAELINVEVNVYGRSPRIEAVTEQGLSNGSRRAGERLAYFAEYGEYRPTRVLDGQELAAGIVVEGPAIVEEETTSIVVFPGSLLQAPRPEVYVMRVGS